MVTFGGKLSLTDSLLLPAPAPGGALSIHIIKTQSPLQLPLVQRSLPGLNDGTMRRTNWTTAP
jgi:hypothetical protein